MIQGSGQMGELLGRRRCRRRRCRRRRRRRCRRPATGNRPTAPRRPPATPRDINIGANMDRTIHYFQDRTDIWIVRSTISRIGLSWKNPFSNISRIIENVADIIFQYFQDSNK